MSFAWQIAIQSIPGLTDLRGQFKDGNGVDSGGVIASGFSPLDDVGTYEWAGNAPVEGSFVVSSATRGGVIGTAVVAAVPVGNSTSPSVFDVREGVQWLADGIVQTGRLDVPDVVVQPASAVVDMRTGGSVPSPVTFSTSIKVTLLADVGDLLFYSTDGDTPRVGVLQYTVPLLFLETTILKIRSQSGRLKTAYFYKT